jgi:uncharacterized protein involved in outer membrane biogenesis
VALAAVLAIALDAGYFKGPFVRFISGRIGREIQVHGRLSVDLLTFHPTVTAERVAIGNPAWTPPGLTAQIGTLSIVLTLPGVGTSLGVERMEMQAATFTLSRDATGHANWQWSNPDLGSRTSSPIVRSLHVPNAHVSMDDTPRHLRFEGTVTVAETGPPAELRPVRIEAAGQMNGREAAIDIGGDPLATASHEKPFHFTFTENSSGSTLTGRGFLSHPFRFDELETTFDATGRNLKDLYFLTGVTLLNTGRYHLRGTLARQGAHLKFSDLLAATGQSDVHGTLSIDISTGRPRFSSELQAKILRSADIGEAAAARDSGVPWKKSGVLPTAVFEPSSLRRADGTLSVVARRLEVGSLAVGPARATATVDHGILVVSPVSIDVLGGKLTGEVKLDAATDVPPVAVDIKLAGAQVGEFFRAGTSPPLTGLLQAHIAISGHGRSVHQVGASATGTVTAVLPHGALRASLAELTGIDLRGLGLLLTKSRQETGVRCAVAGFAAHNGVLRAQNLVMDTDAVLINGSGRIDLDSETMELQIQGHPKRPRLFRLRAPLIVKGSWEHPSIEMATQHSPADTAKAALDAVLRPLVAVLVFVDPGLAKDADCAALLANRGETGKTSP